MKFDVKLFVGGKVFEETVQAVNREVFSFFNFTMEKTW